MEAHQYKIRVEKSKQKPHTLIGKYWAGLDLELKNAIVKKIDRDVAKNIILEYEWLGTMGNTTHHYGIFFDDVCGGVVCFGRNCVSNYNVPLEFGLTKETLWFLARGACVHWTPKGAASKLISQSMKLLKQEEPQVQAVIAYSDVNAGEIGTVYQATNWLYIGQSEKVTVNFYNETIGRKFDERVLHEYKLQWGCSRTEVRNRLLAEGWKIEKKARKHKYLFILGDRKETKAILSKIKTYPYPKRENIDAEKVSVPAKEGSRESHLASS